MLIYSGRLAWIQSSILLQYFLCYANILKIKIIKIYHIKGIGSPLLISISIVKICKNKKKIVRGERDSRANLMPIYGDLYQIKL